MVLSLREFGNSFLEQLFRLIVTDYQFFISIHSILDPEYFVEETYKLLYKIILTHFEKYHSVPSFDTIISYFAYMNKEEIRAMMTKLVHDIKERTSIDELYIKDQTIQFCRHQALKKHMLIASKELKLGNYDVVENILMDALKKIDIEHNLDHDY